MATDTSQYFQAPDSPTVYTDYKSYTQNIHGATPIAESANVYKQPTQTPIAADTMGATTQIKVPGVSTDVAKADGTVAGATTATKGIESYLKEITPPETETSKQYGDLLGQINTLLPELGNKQSDQLKAEESQNLPQLKKDLAGLNSQILTRTAEYEKLNTDIEGKAIPLQFITGQQAQVRRQQASEIGLLQARALGMQGNIQMAQETANRAIDLKYGSIQDEISIKMQQLQLIQPLLDKEERQFAQALELKYRDEQRRYEEEQARLKITTSLALEQGVKTRFVNRNGEFTDINTGVIYGDPVSFFKAAGVSSFEEAYARNMVTDIDMNKIYEKGAVQQLLGQYPDAGITPTDSLATAQSKLSGSRIYSEQVRPPSSGGGGGLTPSQMLSYQNQIQDNLRVDPAIKNYTALVDFGVPSVIKDFNSGNTNSITDTVLMRTLAKVTDPTTGVREGEYETFASAVGAINRLTVLPQEWIGKGRLTDLGRQQMINQIQDRYNAALNEYASSYQYYSGQAAQVPGITIPPPYKSAQEGIYQQNVNGPFPTSNQTSTTSTQQLSESTSFLEKVAGWLWD